MKIRLLDAKNSLVIAALVSTGQITMAQDGGLDGSFTPTTPTNQAIESLVPTTDGGVIASGTFTQIKALDATSTYTNRSHVAKFSSAGSLTSYAPNINGRVINAAIEPDGSAIFTGVFSTANTVSRRHVARYLASGALDTSFATSYLPTDPLNNLSSVTSAARHGSGYLFASDAGLFRTNLTGVHDTTFKRYLSASVGSVTVLPSKQFLMSGPFVYYGTNGSGVDSAYLERLAANGGVSSPVFTHAINRQVYCSAVQADGRILVGGIFGPEAPAYATTGLTRLMPNGEPDEDFQTLHAWNAGSPFIDGAVRSISIQADGRIIIAGDFTNIRTPVKQNGLWVRAVRRGIARLYPDGSFDSTFDAKIDPAFGATPRVYGIAQQADGKILMHGEFLAVNNGTSRPKAARLMNYAATQSLTYDGSVIRWERGGSAPEAQNVVFEHQSVDTDFEWKFVDADGVAGREGLTSNWIMTPATPIVAGSLIRASARVSAGQFNASTSIVSSTIGYMMPKIGLMRDVPNSPILNNGTTSFPTTGVGSPQDFGFTLNNTGDGEMTSVTAVLSGANASEFSILTAPTTSIPAAGNSAMVIRFNPSSSGAKTATLTINSNDPFTPAFTFTITGTALTALEQFRMDYFGTTANTGNAADGQDPDGDGLTNYFEFVAGMIPTDGTSTFTCRVEKTSANPKVIFGPCLNDRTYEVWVSSSLNGDWVAATGTTTAIGTQRTFTHSDTSGTKRFYRVKITRP